MSAFLGRLQEALRGNDRAAVCRLASFPLPVHGEHAFEVDSLSGCIAAFSRIFTPRVRTAVLGQRAEGLFASWAGVMVGSGELWFSGICGDPGPGGPCDEVTLRIIAVNHRQEEGPAQVREP